MTVFSPIKVMLVKQCVKRDTLLIQTGGNLSFKVS